MVGRLIIAFFTLAITFSHTFARTVTIDEAKAISKKFISYNFPSEENYQIVDIAAVSEAGTVVYYKVTLSPKGWLIVSGNDIVQPVLGYNYKSTISNESDWLPSTKEWFNSYTKQIVAEINSGNTERNREWDSFTTEFKSTQSEVVDPLIPVEWNQSSGWNLFCPVDEDGPGGRAYVGCVAVSMAQAMSVYKYPSSPVGSHGYNHDTYGSIFVNYDFEPDYEWELMSETVADEYNARLLYHCAVSVDMGFGPDGSGAYTRNAGQALGKYFGYSSTSMNYQERGSTADEVWEQMLIDELVAGRPIVYDGDAGDGEAGHAFNIDGYNNGYFHLNWGWSGSMNGNYTINNLSPGTHDFTQGHGALTGIRKPIVGPNDIILSNTRVKENLPIGSFVALVDVEDELETNKYTFELFGAPKEPEGYLASKFIIENDSLKTRDHINYARTKMIELRIEVTDSLDNFFAKNFNIIVEENDTSSTTTGPSTVSDIHYKTAIYPNPGYDIIYVDLDNLSHSTKVAIYNTNGQKVLEKSDVKDNEGLDVSALPSGVYVIRFDSNKETVISKFIKK